MAHVADGRQVRQLGTAAKAVTMPGPHGQPGWCRVGMSHIPLGWGDVLLLDPDTGQVWPSSRPDLAGVYRPVVDE